MTRPQTRYKQPYTPNVTDPHYGATEPLEAELCRCDSPFPVEDADERHGVSEVRCLMCGKPTQGSSRNSRSRR